MLSRNQWINIGLSIVVVACVGYYLIRKFRKEEIPTRPPVPATEPLPFEVEADGWRLKVDCTLVLEPQATVRTSPVGRFIDAPAVGVVPTNRAGWTHQIRARSPDGSQAVVRLFHSRIPLKASRQVPASVGDDLFLTENDKLGVPVTTETIRAGTIIMPVQSVEVIDRLGTIVFRHPTE